jgi:hypothetical protein
MPQGALDLRPHAPRTSVLCVCLSPALTPDGSSNLQSLNGETQSLSVTPLYLAPENLLDVSRSFCIRIPYISL